MGGEEDAVTIAGEEELAPISGKFPGNLERVVARSPGRP